MGLVNIKERDIRRLLNGGYARKCGGGMYVFYLDRERGEGGGGEDEEKKEEGEEEEEKKPERGMCVMSDIYLMF